MIYYEYISPDNRVLFNIQQMNFGNRIVSSHEYDLYLIERELAEMIVEYNTKDKSQIPMMLGNDGISYNDLNDWLSHMFTLNEGVIKIVKNTEQTN